MLIWLRRATDSRRGDHTSVLKTSTQNFLIITSCTMDGKFPFFFLFVSVPSQSRPTGRDKLRHGKRIERKEPVGVFAGMAGNNSHNDNNNTQTACCWSWRKALFYFLLFYFIFSSRRRRSKHNRESPPYKETGGKFRTLREKKREKNNGIVCCWSLGAQNQPRVISSRSSAF